MRRTGRWSTGVAGAVLLAVVGATSAGASPAPSSDRPDRLGLAPAAAEPTDVGILATSAPAAIRVGAAEMSVPLTVATGQPMDYLEADLVDRREESLGFGFVEEAVAGRPNVFKPTVTFYADEVTGWGDHAFVLYADRAADDVYAFGVAYTEVKAHSLLGLSATRSGSTTQVRGSARAYHSVQDRYVPWSGRPVSVQRWDGAAWVQVTGVTTDARGNFSSSVRVPAASQLRLVVKDTATTWGAVSGTATV